MKTLKKILLYTATLIHLPWTIFRVIVACVLLVDSWCDKIINNWLNEVDKELNEERNSIKDKHS
jgi:hypothetical protein